MTEQEGSDRKRAPLGPVLWFFVGWKTAGILFNVVLLLLSLLLVMPAVARIGGDAGQASADMSFDLVLLVGDIVGTAWGLVRSSAVTAGCEVSGSCSLGSVSPSWRSTCSSGQAKR